MRILTLALSGLGALSAIGGGIALLSRPHGSALAPLDVIASTAFTSFLIPGLLLALVVGGTNLLATITTLVRSRFATDAVLLAGGASTIWMIAELAQLPGVHALQVIYGAQGLALLTLGLIASWRSPELRHRWIATVTTAETLGYLAPAAVMALTRNASYAVLAGAIEGLALGAGQAIVLPLPIRRVRFALLTSAGAAITWASMLGAVRLAKAGLGYLSPIVALLGFVALLASQWLELRHHSRRAGRWIAWSALAWIVALPLSFLPGPLFDASSPPVAQWVLLACGGALMAYVMAIVTYRGARALDDTSPPKTLIRELRALHLPAQTTDGPLVTEADLAALPPPAQRYLRFMGVVGRPRDWSFRLAFVGRFRPGKNKPWMECEAWQYNDALATARVFHLRGTLSGLPVLARDTYVGGHGRMHVRLFDRFTVADGTGEAFDIGELVTYLNDAVLLAPSMLLAPNVRWTAVDDGAFDLTLTHDGRSVSARVFVGATGAPTDFSTEDRFYTEGEPVRARWTTPVSGWQRVGERVLPKRAQAVWHLPSGDLPYADFSLVPESVAFNVS